GISISDTAPGNTLIIAGTTALSAGLILIGLAAAVDQLRQVTQALRPRPGARPPARPPEPAEPTAPARPVAPSRSPIVAKPNAVERVAEPPPGAPAPRAPVPGAPAPELSASAIERLRSSLARSDRKTGEDLSLSPGAAVPAAHPGAGANGA